MGAASIGIAIFLLFSMGISYLSGDKEKGKIESKLVEEKSTHEKISRELEDVKDKRNKDQAKLKELEEQLREAIEERNRLERALSIEERQKEINKDKTSKVSPVDLEREREKARKEAEARFKNEMDELEGKLAALEEEKAALELANRNKTAENATLAEKSKNENQALKQKIYDLEQAKAASEKAYAALQAENAKVAESGAQKSAEAVTETDEKLSNAEREQIIADLTAKNKAEIAALEAKIVNLTQAKLALEQDNVKKSELAAAAQEREKAHQAELQARIRELDLARKAADDAMAALAAEKSNSGDLVAKLRQMELAKLTAEETLKSREAAYVQAKNALTEVGKDNYKKQVANIESRLVSLEENKKGLEDKWAEAMVAIVKLDETAQKIEANIIRPGAEAQGVDVIQANGSSAIQNDLDTLKAAREKVRLAMENVKSTLQTSMESDTMRMKVEITQISESLDKISLKARPAGLDKTANNDASQIAMNDTIGREGLREETINLKGPSAAKTMKGGDRTEVASLNQKLEGLNMTIDDVFNDNAVAPVLIQPKEMPNAAKSQKHNEVSNDSGLMRPAGADNMELKRMDAYKAASAESKNIVVCTAPVETAKAETGGETKTSYIVKKGDSLWSIAAKKDVYGSPLMWPIIFKYNLSGILNPEIISVNQALSIVKNPTEADRKNSVRRARRFNKEKNDADYIKKIRQEIQSEFLQRG